MKAVRYVIRIKHDDDQWYKPSKLMTTQDADGKWVEPKFLTGGEAMTAAKNAYPDLDISHLAIKRLNLVRKKGIHAHKKAPGTRRSTD